MFDFTTLHFEFNLKTKTVFGVECAKQLPEYLRNFNFTRIGIIIDEGVAGTSYVNELVQSVKTTAGSITTWIYNLKREPDYESLDEIKLLFIDESGKPRVDCFVGIGGGSVIDFAKGMATLVVNPGDARTYRGFVQNITPPLPTIALPTTAGTGSEVTFNAVFIDRASKKKLGINTHYNFPVLALLDPLLTVTCPKSVTVSSGMDALVHTMESFVATGANPLTRLFAREAFVLIFNTLPKVVEAPRDLELRGNLQYGAYLAGISLMNAGSGPAGALSYPLGVHFGVPHGIAGAFFLPHIIAHNVENGYDYTKLYDCIEGAMHTKSSAEKNSDFRQHFFDLNKKINIPKKLSAFSVTHENVLPLMNDITLLEKAFAQNPIPFTVEDGKELVQRLM